MNAIRCIAALAALGLLASGCVVRARPAVPRHHHHAHVHSHHCGHQVKGVVVIRN